MALLLSPREVKFREVNASGVFVSTETKISRAESMGLLQKHGLIPLHYLEASAEIGKNNGLRQQLEGKRFGLRGKGPNELEYYKLDKQGKITKAGRLRAPEQFPVYSMRGFELLRTWNWEQCIPPVIVIGVKAAKEAPALTKAKRE